VFAVRRCALLLITAGLLGAADDDYVFRSDVSLVRVDAQVVDRQNRAITGLSADDFIVRENGQPQKVSHFGSEDVPVDVLLLLDVSGSMRPHIERVAAASRRALDVLGDDDQVAVMVFDRQPRLRVPFRRSAEAIERELHNVIEEESFDGGTDITRALLEAASWIGREARPNARRAIVILTDDQTERNRDDAGVERALHNSNAVVSALLAPDSLGSGRIGIGTGGGGLGGPLGGIILGRRGPLGGGGPVITGPRTRSAGTAEIARRSGGDSMRVDDASALETTLTRIRQRYALHFNLAQGVKPGQERNIEVELTAAAKRRYPDADVRYRRLNQTDTVVASSAPVNHPTATGEAEPAVQAPQTEERRGGWRRADEQAVETAPRPPAPKAQKPAGKQPELSERTDEPRKGGWRRVNPGETP
jgi:VWFA-related protein